MECITEYLMECILITMRQDTHRQCRQAHTIISIQEPILHTRMLIKLIQELTQLILTMPIIRTMPIIQVCSRNSSLSFT